MALQTHENRRTNYRLQKRHRRLRRRTLSKKSSRPILLPRTLGTKNRTLVGRGDRHAVPVCSISWGEINILAEFHHSSLRSEERRVGKECRYRRSRARKRERVIS